VPARARRPPYVVYLRVFEPVAHLPSPASDRWTAYARTRPGRELIEAGQFADSIRRSVARPPVPVPPAESEEGLLLELDGELYVCPQQPRLRALTDLGAVGDVLPAVQTLPPALREQAAADLEALARSGGEVRLFTMTMTWQVPVAWFVPFAADERELDLGRGPGGERVLRYRTAMSSARRRCARGLRAARAHLDDVEVIGQIEQVARWLEQFDPRSIVELDYAALVELLDDTHLLGDDSAADVADGLAALTEGDVASAAAAYRRWSNRWHRVALLARAS